MSDIWPRHLLRRRRLRRLGAPARAAHGAGGAGGGRRADPGRSRGRPDGGRADRRGGPRDGAGRELRARTVASGPFAERVNAVLSRDVAVLAAEPAPDGLRRPPLGAVALLPLPHPGSAGARSVRGGEGAVVDLSGRDRDALDRCRGAGRRARFHRVHADADRARSLRAGGAGGVARRVGVGHRLRDHRRRVHAEHDPRAGRDDARGRRRQADRSRTSRRCSGARRARRRARRRPRTASTSPASSTATGPRSSIRRPNGSAASGTVTARRARGRRSARRSRPGPVARVPGGKPSRRERIVLPEPSRSSTSWSWPKKRRADDLRAGGACPGR